MVTSVVFCERIVPTRASRIGRTPDCRGALDALPRNVLRVDRADAACCAVAIDGVDARPASAGGAGGSGLRASPRRRRALLGGRRARLGSVGSGSVGSGLGSSGSGFTRLRLRGSVDLHFRARWRDFGDQIADDDPIHEELAAHVKSRPTRPIDADALHYCSTRGGSRGRRSSACCRGVRRRRRPLRAGEIAAISTATLRSWAAVDGEGVRARDGALHRPRAAHV